MVSSFAKRPVQTAKAACPGSPKPARRLLPLPILPLLALPFLAFTICDTRAETSGTESSNGARQPVHSAEVTFGVYALGSKGVEMRLATKRGESAVQVDTAMKTAGMLDWVMSFTMTGQVVARIDGAQLRPMLYVTQSDGNWSKRATRMTWDKDGQPIIDMLEPPNETDDREPVPESLLQGTSDPTTAMIARALRGGAEPPCTGMDAIFDGRRRYNMHFTPIGPDWVKPHNRSAYSGPAFKCQVKIEPVAGYTRTYLAEWSEKDEQPTLIWLVQPDGIDAWIPVQLEGGFRLGSAMGWISGAKLNGKEWLAPLGLIRAEIPRDPSP
jgi:hypothetical protein